MDPYKYCVGQTVQSIKSAGDIAHGTPPAGKFWIAALIPDYQGNILYRVESTSYSQQRVEAKSEVFLS